MKVLIVYDSYFGNTQKVASIIGDQLKDDHEVKLVKACEAKQVNLLDIDLLVMGSPTRAFTTTKPIKAFALGLKRRTKASIAVFDTRMDIPKINNKLLTFMVNRFGYANDTLIKILKRKGLKSVACDYFMVKESEGPLVDGEEKRVKPFVNRILSNMSELD